MSRFLISLAVLAWLLPSCSGDDKTHLPPPGDGDADSDGDTDSDTDADGDSDCAIDADGDLHGPLCPAGEDCNDNDPEVWDDCSTCREGVPQEDCPCFGTEDAQDCHSSYLCRDEHGRVVCRVGLMTCEQDPESLEFAWTECVFNDGLEDCERI